MIVLRPMVATRNEIRQKIGMKPSDDPKADQLVNSNISQSKDSVESIEKTNKEGEEIQNE